MDFNKFFLTFFFVLTTAGLCAQSDYDRQESITPAQDSVQIAPNSLNPARFVLLYKNGETVPTSSYSMDFSSGWLKLLDPNLIGQELRVEYRLLPSFMTKKYAAFDEDLIVPMRTGQSGLYRQGARADKKINRPFEGLMTRGSLARGVTIGSNQDAVVNSNFNLQIEGMLSEKVGIRASITDSEVPLQAGGFTQRLDEFDRVYIQLFSDKWQLTAGDIDLINRENYYLRFQKKISGVKADVQLGEADRQTEIMASGALVRGKFFSYRFNGLDGNQGPYRILGPDNQQFALMISGSERVYANGVRLKRGENFDYTIDYNTSEITFTSLYTVTANLRFTVEYQLAERNYTRFLTYDGLAHKADKWSAGVKFFSESDLKNSPLDQNLTEEQKEILAEAGNDTSKMVSPSEVPAVYDENKILYRKEISAGNEIYVYSNNSEDELFQVSFSFLGEGQGAYEIATSLAAGRVYEYVGENNGAYAPVIQLVAPEKLQMLVFDGRFDPNENSSWQGELALSDRDQNLYSSIDNDQNQGLATKITGRQKLKKGRTAFIGRLDHEFLSRNFSSVERLRNVEFSRDWNLNQALFGQGDQQRLTLGLEMERDSTGRLAYDFEYLGISDQYSGQRHHILLDQSWKRTDLRVDASTLKTDDELQESTFDRLYSGLLQKLGQKSWAGLKFNHERNELRNKQSNLLDPISHRFTEFEVFTGYGDSSKVFLELGYNLRDTDSAGTTSFEKVNRAHTYFLKSRLLKNKDADLSLFANYRQIRVDQGDSQAEDEAAINGRLAYRHRILDGMISWQTLLEAQSGSLPQQEFTYVEVEPGKGFYEWIDFNGNGVQELDEFVVARFQDQAIYVRVLLPTVRFIKTNRNKWSQSLNLMATVWRNETGFKRFLSEFSNQAYFLIDSRTQRDGEELDVNPFPDDENLIGLDQSFKNSFFFRRGQQKYSWVYTYLNNRKRTLFVFGDQDLRNQTHQLQFIHKLGRYWLFELEGGFGKNRSNSQQFSNRNYEIETARFQPKVSFLYNPNTRLEFFYLIKDKQNKVLEMETNLLQQLGMEFLYANKQSFSTNANLNLINNDYTGETNSPVAYQLLEGLQPGLNLTWQLGLQKRLTSFLDLNLSYFGRKSEDADAVHSGNVQVRATF